MTQEKDKPVELAELIISIFEHPESPDWLLGGLHDCIADNSVLSAFEPDYIRGMLKGTEIGGGE